MYYKILVIFVLIFVFVYLINNNNTESFIGANPEYPPYVERKGMPGFQDVIPLNKLKPGTQSKLLKETLKNKTLENNVLNYNQILIDMTKDLTYYENNIINQSNIFENANDIINQTDLVDYGDVKTGMQKCNESCDGVCLELGYTGSATCFPKTAPFDYGTLYKNPTFTYGIDQHRFTKV